MKSFNRRIPTTMQRHILSLAPSNTEILCALGLEEEIAAVTEFCDFPVSLRDLPHLKGWISMEEEAIQAFGADLVFTSTICQERLRKKLEAIGIAVAHLDPRT